MSRLARSRRDWHQLLEICALFDTLIADVDGVYDPTHHNDRLLLGLKGTMSEAELHILKARMLEGRLAKARRGELGRAVPMGYVRSPGAEIVLDPHEQAQATIRLVFDLYDRHRTIGKVLHRLAVNDIKLPVRAQGGTRKGKLEWHRASRPSLYCLLVNPIYAGAYVYGMRPTDRRRQSPGHPRTGRRAPGLDNAHVVLHDHVPAYISWERYQENQARLRSNAATQRGPARAGGPHGEPSQPAIMVTPTNAKPGRRIDGFGRPPSNRQRPFRRSGPQGRCHVGRIHQAGARASR